MWLLTGKKITLWNDQRTCHNKKLSQKLFYDCIQTLFWVISYPSCNRMVERNLKHTYTRDNSLVCVYILYNIYLHKPAQWACLIMIFRQRMTTSFANREVCYARKSKAKKRLLNITHTHTPCSWAAHTFVNKRESARRWIIYAVVRDAHVQIYGSFVANIIPSVTLHFRKTCLYAVAGRNWEWERKKERWNVAVVCCVVGKTHHACMQSKYSLCNVCDAILCFTGHRCKCFLIKMYKSEANIFS
jgi:hypothetical protein